ncbi:MAG: LytR C-terminal domain-containing protein [Longimicrobiales bacterium]|nr:LytR C-terminal domain-containing protein [Longimicrobiales bacterium]
MGARVRGVAVVLVVLVTGAALGTWLAQWLQPGATPPAGGGGAGAVGAPVSETPDGRIRVEVLNGGGVRGMARAATDLLRDRGFDVVEVGNWEDFAVTASFVVDRLGDGVAAASAAEALGVSEVRTQAGSNLYADLTVVLGSEWSPERAPPPEPADGVRPWWDLRRYLQRPGPVPVPGTRMVDPENFEGGS